MVRLAGRGAASRIWELLERIEAHLVGIYTENRIPYNISSIHTYRIPSTIPSGITEGIPFGLPAGPRYNIHIH